MPSSFFGKKRGVFILAAAAALVILLILVLLASIPSFPDRAGQSAQQVTPSSTTFTEITASITLVHASTASPEPSITPTALPPEGQAFSIGFSVEGKSLDMYRFGSGPIVRVIIGAIHGGHETNTSTLIYKLRNELRSGSITVPPEITLYLLPIFNPDGYFDYTNQSLGRANAHGVDLNRNWDASWTSSWDRTNCFNAYPIGAGEYAFSEPETAALRDFLLNNHVDALISYHSAMSVIFAGGQPVPDPASESLARALSAVSFYLYPPVIDPGCEYTGQLIDWAAQNGIAAVDIELTDHQSTDILINLKVLEVFLDWER